MPILPAGAAQAAIDAIARHSPTASAKATTPAALARANPAEDAKNFGALVRAYAKEAGSAATAD